MSIKNSLVRKGEFAESDKKGVYRAIYSRRDIRSQFRSDIIPEKVLSRILHAVHHAPSVGFMQPWNFILIKDIKVRQAIHDAFKRANYEATLMFSEDKRAQYQKFKLEGSWNHLSIFALPVTENDLALQLLDERHIRRWTCLVLFVLSIIYG